MTEPTTPEPSARPMPRLGRGGRWGAHIDGALPPAQPYTPPARPRPTSWPKTGSVGATAHLAADEEPVTVPARPYASPEVPRTVDPPRMLASGGGVGPPLDPGNDAIPFPISRCLYEQAGLAAVRRAPEVEQAIADATPQPPHLIGDRIPYPMIASEGPDHRRDPVQSFIENLARRTPRGGHVKFETIGTIGDPWTSNRMRAVFGPPTAEDVRAIADELNAHGGFDETFVAELLREAVKDQPASAPAPEPITYESIVEALEKIAPLSPPPAPIKLTREQWAAVPKAPPRMPGQPDPALFGTPVEIVECAEDSTLVNDALARQYARLGVPRLVTAKERVTGFGPPFVSAVPPEPTGPREHQHIWTTTSPMRCVECRRFLRPWWRRALDRVRRWTR